MFQPARPFFSLLILTVCLFRLVSQLEERVAVVTEEMASLEGVDRRAEELQDKLGKLSRALAAVKVWHQDHAETEEKLAVRRINIFFQNHYIQLWEYL